MVFGHLWVEWSGVEWKAEIKTLAQPPLASCELFLIYKARLFMMCSLRFTRLHYLACRPVNELHWWRRLGLIIQAVKEILMCKRCLLMVVCLNIRRVFNPHPHSWALTWQQQIHLHSCWVNTEQFMLYPHTMPFKLSVEWIYHFERFIHQRYVCNVISMFCRNNWFSFFPLV